MTQIQENHPALDAGYARALAGLIEDIAKAHNVDSARLAAIAMQESAYVANAKHCYRVKGKVRCDYCMMQINDRTIKRYGFDQKLLMTNVAYCIDAGATVLADFKRMYGKRDHEYWTRYNASDREMRDIYRVLVNRWM